jgi:nucleoside-diphosphate-sugar epimerase
VCVNNNIFIVGHYYIMNILLTGGNGFVGCNIVNEIRQTTDWDITCFVNKHHSNIPDDIRKIHGWEELEAVDIVFDFIIHAGGNSSSKSCIECPGSAFRDNIEGTFKILEYARKREIKNIIFFSSCEVYGHSTDTSRECDALVSYNMYGASKIACESMCSAYFHSYGIHTVAIRLLNTYGPFCQEERFPSIIRKKFEGALQPPHFVLSCQNARKRWLSIREMARRVVFLVKNMPTAGFETFNFVGDENLFAENRPFTYEYTKQEIAGYHHDANADGSKFADYYRRCMDR